MISLRGEAGRGGEWWGGTGGALAHCCTALRCMGTRKETHAVAKMNWSRETLSIDFLA